MNLYLALINDKIVFATLNKAEMVPYDNNDRYTIVTIPGVVLGLV